MSPAVAVPETECHSLTPWFIEPIEYLQRGYRSFRQMGVERAGVDVEPSASLALANALASCLLRTVSVARACERFPTRSLGSNETY
jgi:hypothetical protein